MNDDERDESVALDEVSFDEAEPSAGTSPSPSAIPEGQHADAATESTTSRERSHATAGTPLGSALSEREASVAIGTPAATGTDETELEIESHAATTNALRTVIEWTAVVVVAISVCLLYTSPSPRDRQKSRMPSSA